ncbi:MAG: hypothetical protein LBR52_03110 [Prevotellaceae bacterium]|jgi:hypothetical protein|nr:hypothetical protein [Prevotellaceae bacterium]
MATITLEYDDRSSTAKKALDFILSLGFFHSVEKKQSELDLAIRDVEAGRTNKYKNSKELFKKLKRNV